MKSDPDSVNSFASVMFASTLGLAFLVIAVQAQQPAQPVDPSPQNGEVYYLVDQISGLQADLDAGSTASGSPLLQNTMSLVTLTQRWAFTKLADGNWKIGNIANGLCMDSQQTSTPVAVVQQPCTVSQSSQEWSFTYTTNGYYTIANSATGLLLDIAGGVSTAGAQLVQTALSTTPAQSQLWLFRPAFFRGNDNALLAKQEADRLANPTAFFNDAGQTQDALQILKNHGFNMIRVRPTPLVVPGTTTPLYSTYTLGSSSNSIPATCTGNGCGAETDAADLAIAKRAKQLGLSVELTMFFDGGSSTDAPAAWAGYTSSQVASAIYTYVKAQVEEYRAAGVMPDVVSIGNEVDTGFLGSGVGSGASGSPSGAYNSAAFSNFAAYQKQGMQAVLDAASDTTLGPAIPPPLRCIHTTPAWAINSFFPEANQAGIPYDLVCQSYYPIDHGPLTSAQAASCKSTTSSETEQQNLTNGANTVGKPILMLEIGERYEIGYGTNDCFYPVSRAGQRQFALDMESTLKALPGNLAAGMEWWDSTGTNVPLANGSYANYFASGNPYDLFYWDGFTLFDDADNGSYTDNFSAPTYNSVLPAMTAVGGKLDPSLTYKLLNVANGRILETASSPAGAGAALDTAADTGVTSLAQQWQISSNGDGYFQVANVGASSGTAEVLDNGASSTSGSVVVLQPAVAPASAQQEWDVVTAANGSFTLVGKQSGLVLAADTSSAVSGVIEQQSAQSTNSDWIAPASSAQQWQIVPVHITGVTTGGNTASTLAFTSVVPATLTVGSSLGTVSVSIQNGSGTTVTSSSATVTLVLSGPSSYSQAFKATSSLGVATFSLAGANLPAVGVFTLTATSPGLISATASLTSTPAVLTVAAQNLSKVYGAANPTLTYTVAGFVNSDTQAVLSGAPTLSTTATATSAVGSYPIAISAGTLAAANYTFSFVNGTLSIVQASTSVTWTPATTHNYNGQPLGSGVLDAASTTPGVISYTAALSGGSPLTITATSGLPPGVYTLVATLTPTDAVDFAASSDTASFTVLPQSIWVSDSTAGLSEFNDGGGASATQAFPGGILGVAVDNSGSIWSATASGIAKTSPAGIAQLSLSGIAGLNAPTALAVDGLGQIWVANANASVSVLSNAGAAISSASGYTDPSLSGPTGIAIDSSGNVWVANATNNSVTEILGAANPVAPITNSVVNNSLGVRP